MCKIGVSIIPAFLNYIASSKTATPNADAPAAIISGTTLIAPNP